jgi:hypothetical protein
VTTTATSATGDTSEFSVPVAVTLAPPPGQNPPPGQSVVGPTAQAVQAAVQVIQFLHTFGGRVAGAAFADLSGDNANDIALVFKRKCGKLLVVTLDRTDGRILGAFGRSRPN